MILITEEQYDAACKAFDIFASEHELRKEMSDSDVDDVMHEFFVEHLGGEFLVCGHYH